jgi:hypothetical protein
MRTLLAAVVALGLVGILVSPALAAPFWSETFSYPDGGLTTVSSLTWTIHSGSGTDIQVVNGVAVGDMANAPDVNRLFPSPRGATDQTYASFNVLIPSVTGTPGTNYFAHFRIGNLFRSKTWVTASGSSFTFGLSAGGNTLAPPTGATWPVALNYGQWYTVVIRYDAAAGVSQLWVDPIDETSSHITATDSQSIGQLIESFAFRQSNTSPVLWQFQVDNVVVGATFNDVNPNPPTATLGTSWGRIKALYR